MNDKSPQPVESETLDYKSSKYFSITNDAWNDAVNTLRTFSRVRQWMDKSAGTTPEPGEQLNVEFDDGTFQTYTVEEVVPGSRAIPKRPDKYRFRCSYAGNDDDYPQRITLGIETGSYVQK